MARFLVSALGFGSTALLSIGCGAGVPLLHGAHALSPGKVTSGVGFSGVFTAGGLRDAVEAGRRYDPATGTNRDIGTESGAVVAGAGPGVAPFVGMRVGIAGDNEAGLSFTGRSLRLDARHAFESGPFALSLGAGASRTIDSVKNSEALPQQAPGDHTIVYGGDVPVLFGWRSDAGVVSLWAGARGGFEKIGQSGAPRTDLTHWSVGGLAGLAMGFRHVHVGLGLETAYHWVSGTYADYGVKVHGLTLTPCGGLLLTF